MIRCRFTKRNTSTVIYMIIDHEQDKWYPSTRPATKQEIQKIQIRDERKRMDRIIKEYNKNRQNAWLMINSSV